MTKLRVHKSGKINVPAPVSSTLIIVGKTMSGAVMGVVSALVLLIIGATLFGVSFADISAVILIVLLASFSFTGIGTIISGLASEPGKP